MKATLQLSLLGFAAIVFAQDRRGTCGTEGIPYPVTLPPLVAAAVNQTGASDINEPPPPATTFVKTWIHLVGRNNSVNDVAENRLFNQIATLNTAYRSVGFQFTLAGFDRYVDPNPDYDQSLAVGADFNKEFELKAPRRNGTYADLNLYYLSDYDPIIYRQPGTNDSTFGTCGYPQLGPTPEAFSADGCLLRVDSMTGTSRDSARLGYTTVHEVGHWLGLIHVWGEDPVPDPNCLLDDGIADTGLQRDPSSGCPARLGTLPPRSKCPGVITRDNSHNYMDYADDACTDSFTRQQINVMHQIYDITRAPYRTP